MSQNITFTILCSLLLAGCDPEDTVDVEDDRATTSTTMTVQGRHLYSAAGEKVVLRGVNLESVWSSDPRGEVTMAEVAQTGANAVRIVWNTAGQPDDFAAVVKQAIDNRMIAYVSCFDATGEIDKVSTCVDLWTQPEMVSVIQDNKRWVLLNIANEAGDANVNNAKFVSTYEAAISDIRQTGIEVPLVIDASRWGQRYGQLFQVWKQLRDHDPQHNLMFSTHSYWRGTRDEKKAHYDKIAEQVVAQNIPLHLGEGPTPTDSACESSPYGYGMHVLDNADIGWLAWSWGAIDNDDCGPNSAYDITTSGMFGSWQTEIGEQLAVSHPRSIKNTAVRPASILQ